MTDPAQYDEFAADYQRTKEAPLRLFVEAHSFMAMLGDVRGLNVLDLACGDAKTKLPAGLKPGKQWPCE